MRNKRSEEIRTPRYGVKVGEKTMRGSEPVLLVKNGKVWDTISLGELAEALGKPGCSDRPAKSGPGKDEAV
jgi:hypothetical protein